MMLLIYTFSGHLHHQHSQKASVMIRHAVVLKLCRNAPKRLSATFFERWNAVQILLANTAVYIFILGRF